jgi:hypothetical protein
MSLHKCQLEKSKKKRDIGRTALLDSYKCAERIIDAVS